MPSKLIVTLLAAVASAAGTAPGAPAPAPGCDAGPARGILVILCDQLNAGVLGCYGGPVPTPNIDRIAREGVLFQNATCAFPICSPSRATIVTGLYPHAHGIAHNVMRRDYPAVTAPRTQEGLKIADVTTEAILHGAGYATHFYGKWHLTDDDLPYYTDMFGEHGAYAGEMAAEFENVRRRDRASWMDWYGWALPVAVDPAYRDAVARARPLWGAAWPHLDFIAKTGRLTLPAARTFDVRVADKITERIRSLRGRNFMLTCSFNAPHDPNVVPSPYYESVDPARIRFPANLAVREARHETSWSRRIAAGLGERGLREFLRVYHAMVKMIDDQVGRVLRALEETAWINRTTIVFTADHGDMAGAHGMVWKSNGSFYDDIVRVPLLIRCPWLFAPGSCEMDVGLVDLMPTLLDIAGVTCPAHVQGRSLVRFLTGRSATATEHRPFSFCERVPSVEGGRRRIGPRPGASFMVRGQGWKYIRYADGDEVLYDLRRDPGETINRIDEPGTGGRLGRMRTALEHWLDETGWSSTAGQERAPVQGTKSR